MAGPSSRPHSGPRRTGPRQERRIIKVRLDRRWGPARIAYRLGLHPSTVHRVVVLARNATKATAVVRDGATLAITESAAPRWRIYQLSALSTPLSLLGGTEGLPGSATQHPLEPVPPRVLELAEDAEVNLAELIAAVRAR